MSVIGDLGTAVAKQALEIAIDALAAKLIAGRSCIIQVNNRTSGVLLNRHHGHTSGGWASGDVSGIPDPEIPANSAAVFGSESTGFMTGAIGFVVYDGDSGGFELTVRWENPFIGAHSALITVAGPTAHHYRRRATAGAGDQKAHFEFDFTNEPVVREFQDEWRWCHKCTSLFWSSGREVGGRCPAGGQHDRGPSSNYLLRWEPPFTGQDEWRWCSKCSMLFWSSGHATAGHCPAGGQHDRGPSSNYFLAIDDPNAPGQDNWRFCHKCTSLFWSSDSPPAGGRCPNGDAHDGTTSSNYTLIMQ